jgi:DNA-binding Lrp family transcriptional regulator
MEPLGSYQRLARLAGISAQTVKRRMLALSDASALIRVGARIRVSALGLQVAPALASVPFSKVSLVEKACDLHPYTRYRVRCLGSTNGLFMIFANPNGTEFQLTEFFEELKGLGLVTDYKILHTTAEPVYRNPDLRIYDAWSDSWKFKTEKWVQSLDREHREDLQQFAPSTLTNLDIRDLKLLRLLTQDARKPQKLLSKELHVPEYHVSRRLKFIFDNGIVPSCEVFLGKKLFRHAPAALFEASCDLNMTRAIATGLKTLPFQASLFPTSEGFLLFSALPTPLFTEIGTAILERSGASNLMWTDFDTSMRYYFDESPYVEQTGEWKANRDFVVDEPLASLREHMAK